MRGRFSKRSASPPDPLSRRVAGNRLVCSFGVVRPCELGAASCLLVESTAADRAAAPVRGGGRPPPPAYGGYLPFQGRLCVEVCPKGSLRGSMRGAAAKPLQVTVSCPLGTTKGLCDHPLETFARSPLPTIWYPTLAGRGGSVSRRDHNPAAGTRTHLSGGTKPEETSQPKRQPLFGREGSGGRGASLREAASPPRISPSSYTSLGSFEIYIVALVVLGELRYNEGV